MAWLLGVLHKPWRKVHNILFLHQRAAGRLPKQALCHKGWFLAKVRETGWFGGFAIFSRTRAGRRGRAIIEEKPPHSPRPGCHPYGITNFGQEPIYVSNDNLVGGQNRFAPSERAHRRTDISVLVAQRWTSDRVCTEEFSHSPLRKGNENIEVVIG